MTVPNEAGVVNVDVPRFKEVDKLIEPRPSANEDVDASSRGVAAPSSMFTGRRKLGVAFGAAGVLAVGGAVALGLQTKGFEQDAAELCPVVNACARADEANTLVKKAEHRALYANVAYGVAGAAIVAAAVLWFTGAPEQAPAPSVAPAISSTSIGLDVVVRF